MTLTTFIVFLVGSALSLRFSFLILYPATVFAAIATAAYGTISGDGIGATMLMLPLGATAVQLGYLFGLLLRAMLASFGGIEIGRATFGPSKSHG
jgi:hypothetical protein